MYANEIATHSTFQQLRQLGFYLYYDPQVAIQHIDLLDHINNVIANANCWLKNTLDIDQNAQARLVNINRFAESIARRGSTKPMMLNWSGDFPYIPGNGGTRMLAIEVLTNIRSAPAFITSVSKLALEEVTSVAQFQQLCQCPGSEVYLRLSNTVGIEWFEISSQDQDLVVYDDFVTAQALKKYLSQQENFEFSRAWFATPINWSRYFI